MIDYTQLNHYIPPEIAGVSEPWKRVLGRLGDYTALVVRTLNIRPASVQLLGQTNHHVLVRIATEGNYVVLRIAPEADLSAALYFGRAMASGGTPGAQIIHHDLSKRMVPFAYLLERYVAGTSGAYLQEPHRLRAVARQAGRALRRMHRVSSPGWGRPSTLGRWPAAGWGAVLAEIHATFAPPPTDAMVFDEAARQTIATVLVDPRICCERPGLMHGAFGPQAIRCTAGPGVQIEAIVEPGQWVGGDGLLDVAQGLQPGYPAAWREGLLDGYVAAGALSTAEHRRLTFLRLLACYWNACHSYAHAEPHEAARDEALLRIAALAT